MPALIFSGCSLSGGNTETKKTFFAMDTVMTLTVYGRKSGTADAKMANSEIAAEKAAARILEIEAALSVTSDTSELSRLNASENETAEASDDVLIPLGAALGIAGETGGALDVTVLPLVRAWGFLSKEYRVPSREELDTLLQNVGYSRLRISGREIVRPPGTELDFGAVAKGYAAQEAAELLRGEGVAGAVISLGGNVQTVGQKPGGEKWRIAVADPLDPDHGTIGTLSVGEAAVVTSGGYQRFFERGTVRYHHILDPKKGMPAENELLSVTVVCDNGTKADGLSTALFVMGFPAAMEHYKLQSDLEYGGFEAVFVTKDRRVIVTDGLKQSFAAANNKYDYE